MKITVGELKKIIREEQKRRRLVETGMELGSEEDVEKRASEVEEYDSDELANALEKEMDWMKVLDIDDGTGE